MAFTLVPKPVADLPWSALWIVIALAIGGFLGL